MFIVVPTCLPCVYLDSFHKNTFGFHLVMLSDAQ